VHAPQWPPCANLFAMNQRLDTYASGSSSRGSGLATFAQFCAIGSVATAIQYVGLIALVEMADVRPTIASSMAFTVSALFNYLANRRLTFRSGRPHRQAAPRFVLMVALGLAVNFCVIWLLLRLQWHYLIGQIIATAIVLILNFALARAWVFSGTNPT
jgi:putative flippase GtrA